MADNATAPEEPVLPDVVFNREECNSLVSQAAGVKLLVDDDDYIDDAEEAESLLADKGLQQRKEISAGQSKKTATLSTTRTISGEAGPREGVAVIDVTSKSTRASNVANELTQDSGIRHELAQAVEMTSKTLETIRAEYRTLRADEGLFQLCRKALHEERQQYKTLHDIELPEIELCGYSVLIGTHPEILDSILRGDVARTYVRDKEFRKLLDTIREHERARSRPAVYLNQIADARGHSPSPNDVLQIIPKLIGYVNGTDANYIALIDKMTRSGNAELRAQDDLYRKYMYSRGQLSATRQAKTSAFLHALKNRCLSTPAEDRHLPLAGWVPELGYTHATENRLRQHKSHQSSNYIMNLFDCALSLEWPQRFSVQQFIIFVCTHPTEAVMAEILFTRLALGYTGNGGGFTHYPPGLSNDSARWYHTEEWESWYEWTAKVCLIEENEKKEVELWEANAKERAEMIAKIEENERFIAENPLDEAELGTEGMSIEEIQQLTIDLNAELQKKNEEAARAQSELDYRTGLLRDWARRYEELETGEREAGEREAGERD